MLLNTLYSELATMFPEKSGGLALYANEGWRKYTTLVGPVATFGYWIGWSVVLSFLGIFIGQLIQGAWFPGEPVGSPLGEGYFSTGGAEVGLPQLIAIGLILAVWLFNVFGARVSVTFGYIAGALLMIPLAVFAFGGYVTGEFTTANMTWGQLDEPGAAWGGLQLALVWLWLMAWSAWGVDTCATFAPEYKDTVNDTRLALRSAALFSLAVYILIPLGMVGTGGEEAVASYDYVGVLNAHRRIGRPRGLLPRGDLPQLPRLDEHGHRRRRAGAVRDLPRRDDDQADGSAQPLRRARDGHDDRHGDQHPLRPLRREHLRDPRGEQPRLRARALVRPSGFILLRKDRPNWPTTDPARRDLGADRGDPRGVVPDPDDRRLRLVPDGGRWLRRDEGEGDRRARCSPSACSSSSCVRSCRRSRRPSGARRRRRCRPRQRLRSVECPEGRRQPPLRRSGRTRGDRCDPAVDARGSRCRGSGPGERVPAGRAAAAGTGEARVGLVGARGRDLRARAVARGELGDGVEELLVLLALRAGADHQHRARAVVAADEHVLHTGRAVEEVPGLQRALLAVDEQAARAVEDEERLLEVLGVVEAVRLAGLEHADVDADLLEPRGRALEAAGRAERLARPPLGVGDVDHEPALAAGGEARPFVGERRFGHPSRVVEHRFDRQVRGALTGPSVRRTDHEPRTVTQSESSSTATQVGR